MYGDSVIVSARRWCSSVALLAALTTAACGGEKKAAPVEHAPVKLDDAQSATVARFVGTWTHAGGAAEQDAANNAVKAITAEMNGLIRGMAEERLLETVRLDATITFSEKDGIVTITRSEQPQPFKAPADGRVFDMQTAKGDDAKGSLQIEGETLVTKVETDEGGGGRTYSIDAEGNLQISSRTFSPRLPGDVLYTAHYAKP